MASSLYPGFCLLITLLLVTHPVSPAWAIPDQVTADVCKNTKYPPLCFRSLKSHPGSAKPDLLGLSGIAIGLSSTRLTDNFGVVHFLLNKTQDPQVRKRANLCLDVYKLTKQELNFAKSSLQSDNYQRVIEGGQGCLTPTNECTYAFQRYPPFLPHENEQLTTYWQVVVNVADGLNGKKS